MIVLFLLEYSPFSISHLSIFLNLNSIKQEKRLEEKWSSLCVLKILYLLANYLAIEPHRLEFGTIFDGS